MTEAAEIWRGGVNTWECDEMGHMNVRFYVSHFMQGLAGLALRLGLPRAFAPDAPATLWVEEQHIRFLREARAGAPLVMTGGVVALDETGGRVLQVLSHVPGGEPCATAVTRVTHGTPEGRVFPWPARACAAAEGLRVELPVIAGPRSTEPGPVGHAAGLEAANRLGVSCSGRGTIMPGDCDPFGRMRPEMFIARVSDGVNTVLTPVREGVAASAPAGVTRLGNAVLEYRLVYLAWPRAGAHVELRSGLVALEDKTMRMRHWLLDPVGGGAWAVAESIGVNLDLDARRIVPIPEAVRARCGPQLVEGMEL